MSLARRLNPSRDRCDAMRCNAGSGHCVLALVMVLGGLSDADWKTQPCKPRPGRLAYSTARELNFSSFDYLIKNPQDSPRAIIVPALRLDRGDDCRQTFKVSPGQDTFLGKCKQIEFLIHGRYRTVLVKRFEYWRGGDDDDDDGETADWQQISSGLILVDDDHNSQSVSPLKTTGRTTATDDEMSHPSIFSSQASRQAGKQASMHARRAASEIERAIRGVTKGGRSSGQQARAGDWISVGDGGWSRGWKQARAANRRIRSHNAKNNAGVRRIEVPGAESSGEL